MNAAAQYQQPKPAAAAAKAAFGRLEVRELEYLMLTQVPDLDRLLFAVLKVRYDTRSGAVADRIDTLARWSGMSYRAVQRSLNSLKARGVITRSTHGLAGGSRRQTVTWRTAIVPYEEWPATPLEQIVVSLDAHRALLMRKGHATQAHPTTLDTPRTIDGHARNARRSRLATRNIPASYPESFPERDGSLEEDEDEGTSGARDLGTRWVTSRLKAGLHRFTDGVALRWLNDRAAEATEAGATDSDLERAFRDHVDAVFADTREFGTWALQVRDARLDNERQLEFSRAMLAQREAEDREHQARLADPDEQARIREIIRCGRELLAERGQAEDRSTSTTATADPRIAYRGEA